MGIKESLVDVIPLPSREKKVGIKGEALESIFDSDTVEGLVFTKERGAIVVPPEVYPLFWQEVKGVSGLVWSKEEARLVDVVDYNQRPVPRVTTAVITSNGKVLARSPREAKRVADVLSAEKDSRLATAEKYLSEIRDNSVRRILEIYNRLRFITQLGMRGEYVSRQLLEELEDARREAMSDLGVWMNVLKDKNPGLVDALLARYVMGSRDLVDMIMMSVLMDVFDIGRIVGLESPLDLFEGLSLKPERKAISAAENLRKTCPLVWQQVKRDALFKLAIEIPNEPLEGRAARRILFKRFLALLAKVEGEGFVLRVIPERGLFPPEYIKERIKDLYNVALRKIAVGLINIPPSILMIAEGGRYALEQQALVDKLPGLALAAAGILGVKFTNVMISKALEDLSERAQWEMAYDKLAQYGYRGISYSL